MFVFPLAISLTLFSTTAFLIVLAVLGRAELAAEVAVVQGASLGVFLAFSANGRNLVLSAPTASRFVELVRVRLLLLPLLCAGVWLLSTWVVAVEPWLMGGILLRRALEWLGELSLSESERERDTGPARRFSVGQILSFALLAAAAFAGDDWLKAAMLLWSLSPLMGGGGWVRPVTSVGTWRTRLGSTLRAAELAAHLTSSWAIGLSTYLFRLLLILLAGKALAGSLVAGFALGGMLNSLYTYAVGPSLASGSFVARAFPSWVGRALIAGSLALGLVTAALPGLPLQVQPTEGTNWPVFIQTVGLSIVGALIMIWAQSIRLKLLHATHGDDVMVPDVLANVLILAGVPFIHNLLGSAALPFLFLWNAVLTAAIYWFVLAEETGKPAVLWSMIGRDRLQAFLTLLLCLPLFFQLSGEVFRSRDIVFDSQGDLLRVPLPVSAVFGFLGLAVLLKVQTARFTATFLFAFFLTMLPNVLLVAASDSPQQLDKMILLIQFILPVFALVLGQSYVMPARTALRYDVVMFAVALAVMSSQVLATWIQKSTVLVPHLYLFSVYQHLQYVPALMLVLFGLGLPTVLRRDRWRPWVIATAPVCAIYAAWSASMLALGLAAACMAGGTWLLWADKRRGSAVLWLALFAAPVLGFAQLVKTTPLEDLGVAWQALPTETGRSQRKLPATAGHEVANPKLSGKEVGADPKSLLFGHAERPDRISTPSAHNYYLDLVYNFGVVALVPWLLLFVRSAKLAWIAIRKRTMTTDLFWLLGAVAFFALIDSLLKVGFRQPYPGILMLFLWGVLLARLSAAAMEPRA